jgi:hypothetical protein
MYAVDQLIAPRDMSSNYGARQSRLPLPTSLASLDRDRLLSAVRLRRPVPSPPSLTSSSSVFLRPNEHLGQERSLQLQQMQMQQRHQQQQQQLSHNFSDAIPTLSLLHDGAMAVDLRRLSVTDHLRHLEAQDSIRRQQEEDQKRGD